MTCRCLVRFMHQAHITPKPIMVDCSKWPERCLSTPPSFTESNFTTIDHDLLTNITTTAIPIPIPAYKPTNTIVIICITVLTILAIGCLVALYFCCKKHLWLTSTIKTTLDDSNSECIQPARKSVHPSISTSTIPTIQNAVDNSSSTGSTITPYERTTSNKAVETSKRPNSAQSISKQRRQSRKHLSSIKFTRPHASPTSPIMMDKAAITAEMFSQANILEPNSKKEIVLFKSPSFSE
mgnify:CR=1 FL=1